MTVAHDAFEALAGAIALGEATPLERARFATHAASCAMCAGTIDDLATVRDALVVSRDDERWRPSVDARVHARIIDARHRRTRATFGAFHWAIAFSLALNVAFFSGFVGRLATKLDATGEPTSAVVATMWVTEHRRSRPVAASATTVVASRVAARPARTIVARRARPTPHRTVRAVAATLPIATEIAARAALGTPDAIPDVLAGLDVDAHAARRVARMSAARCDTATHDDCPVERATDGL